MGRPTDVCKLCLQVRPLCRSHLLPRQLYTLLHEPGDPKHFTIRSKKLIRTTRQIHEHLLCEQCEERFNSGGERWVIANAPHPSGSFYLRDALRAATPNVRLNNSLAYSGTTPGVNIDKLVYFAASVFWRTTVGKWSLAERWFGNDDKLDLGKLYTEELRLFLLSERTFPPNAALVVYVSDQPTPYASFTVAGGGRQKEGYFQYSFQIPGMMFFIVLGKFIPDHIRLLCAVSNPVDRLIFLTTFPDEFTKKWTLEKMAKLRVAPF